MIALLIVLLVVSVGLVVVLAFLLGFGLGGVSWASEVQRVRARASMASREMHDLTRAAFLAMTEEAEERRRSDQ